MPVSPSPVTKLSDTRRHSPWVRGNLHRTRQREAPPTHETPGSSLRTHADTV